MASISVMAAVTLPALGSSAFVASADTPGDFLDPSVTAQTEARETGRRVENISARTPASKTFANPDGSWTEEATAGPVRALDLETRQWEPIDTSLGIEDDAVKPASALGALSLSNGGSRILASMIVDGEEISWRWPTPLPRPVLRGETATYRDVVENGDLVVTATADGFRYDVVLSEVPENPENFELPIAVAGPDVRVADDGSTTIKSDDGTDLAKTSTPVMYSDAADGNPTTAPEILQVDTVGKKTPDGAKLIMQPDADFLTAQTTRYPVVIDPTVSTFFVANDTYIGSGDTSSRYPASEELRVGTNNGGSNKYRTFLQFSSGAWSGEQINSATLRLRNFESLTCSGSNVRVQRVTAPYTNTTVTWANQPGVTATGSVDTNASYGASGCSANYMGWDVTSIVQAWSSGTANNGLRVAAVNETINSGYRRFRSDNYSDSSLWPRLTINFNRKPSVVGANAAGRVWPGGTHFVDVTAPTLRAQVLDNDNDNTNVTFDVLNSDGTLNWNSTVQNVASGSIAAVTVPEGHLRDGAAYRFRVTASDGGSRVASFTTANVRVASAAYLHARTAAAATEVVDMSRPEPIVDDGSLAKAMWSNFQNGVAACMAAKGVNYVPNSFPADMDVTSQPSDSTYGVTSAVTAPTALSTSSEAFFTSLDAAQRDAYSYALRLLDVASGTFDPNAHDGVIEAEFLGAADQTEGCESIARAVIAEPARAGWNALAEPAYELVEDLEAEPDLVAAERRWTSCMSDAGLYYESPAEPSESLMLEGQSSLSASSTNTEKQDFAARETQIARQDSTCRQAASLSVSSSATPWTQFLQQHESTLEQASGAAGVTP